MGCFMVLKSKKKKNESSIHTRRVLPQEQTSTTLPEPPVQSHGLQSAPPSFRTRGNSKMTTQSSSNKLTSNRVRALSAPSSLHGTDRENSSPADCDEQEDQRSGHLRPAKEQRSPSPQPLPLPAPQCSTSSSALKSTGSFKSGSGSGPLYSSGPLPLPPSGTPRSFSFEEIASACHNFSPDHCTSEGLSSAAFRAYLRDGNVSSRKIEATVTRFYPSTQGLKEFVNEVNTIATLQHPNLCKLLGYHARENSEQKILVYERLHHGSLDHLLYGRSDGPPIDWSSRVKIALCAAHGLTFLHEEGPFQAMYNEFSTANIQVDKDFSAKLSGYGCVSLIQEALCNNSPGFGNLSVETVERGLLTPKSNVYSFGIVLLELLTGRKNMDSQRPKEERNLVKWSWPFLVDEYRLSLIMDPQLKGRFPMKAARTVADMAKKCLLKDPSERPTMRSVGELIKSIQDMKYSCRFPLQEPRAVIGATRKQMARSPSLNGIIINPFSSRHNSFSRSSFSGVYSQSSAISPTRPLSVPLSFPSRGCSSLLVLDEIDREIRKSTSSSAPLVRRASVEGF